MPGNFVERRPVQTNWGGLGETIANPFEERRKQEQAIQATLMPLLFKAELEKRQKNEEIAQFPERLKSIMAAISPSGKGGKVRLEGVDPVAGTYKLHIETPKEQAEQKILDYQLSELDKEQSGIQPDLKQFIPEGEPTEDYRLKPTITKIKGIPQKTFVAERKRDLSPKQIEDLSAIQSTINDLSRNVNTLNTKKLTLGPGLSTPPGMVGDILGQMKGSDFATLKSDVGRAFQKYRKWATGVAAGYPELNLLAPNFPKPTDVNKVFIAKTNSAINEMEQNRQTILDYLGKSGYAVGKYKQGGGNSGFQDFVVNGIPYKIPADKVDAFKKAKGIK